MNTTTRFRNLVRKMVLPLAVCGMMCATEVFAQSGDIIGFYSTSKDSTFTAPGATVQFTIRLFGTIVVSNLFNTSYVQPQVRLEVGSDGASSSAYATLISSAWTGTPFDAFNRTDLTFAYTIRPGDMADPMKIFGTPLTGFTILNNQCWIYKAYPGGVWSNVTWKVNTGLYDEPGANGLDSSNPSGTIVYGDVDMSYQNIRLRTLSYDAANSPNTLVARAPARTWRIQSGGTNSIPVKVWVWTPHTNVLQIGTSPGLPLEVTIPAGSDYVDFPIKGLATNAIPTIATVYAQRPSDYAKNSTTITNFITRNVTITPAGAPTISLEFSNGAESQTLSETNDVDTGSFQIVLSEATTNRVYVDFTIAHQPATLTNIIITPQPGGYYVEAGQEKSDPYYFSVVNGTRESARPPYVRITPTATNTAIYTIARAGILNIPNVAPSVLWYPPATGDENTPVVFDWSDLIDVDADINRGITFRWNFGDSAPVVQTNFTTFGQITHTYAGIGDVPRNYTVTLTITDADGGSYTLPSHTITITPAPKPANVSIAVNRDDLIYQEGDTTARYRVILSAPALQNTMISLVAQYVVDGTSADACLGLSVTNNIIIPTGLTSSVPFTMSIKDGTTKTTSGILIVPTITNAAALLQYPGAYSGIVIIENVAPGIDTVPTCQPTATAVAPYNAIELGKPFTFRYSATDITADVSGIPPITVEFLFQDGVAVTNTGVSGTVTHTFTALGGQSVTMIATDKDGGQRTVTFPITIVPPLPPPSITVFDYPVFIAENDSTTAKQLTIQLSQAPITTGLTNPVVVFLDVTPVNSAVNGAITIPASVTFYSSQTTKTVNFTVQDGTVISATSGFLVTPRIAVGAPGDAVYVQREPGNILVQNVAPLIMQPIDGSTNTVATVGQSRTFTWSVRDVTADLPTMQLVWDWGDGTTSTTTGGSGSIAHTYMSAAAQLSVSVTATDKDGDYHIITFYVTVKDSKKIIALPIGPNTAGFNGLTDLGTGTIIATNASPTVWDPVDLFYTFYFSADAMSAQLLAVPTPTPLPLTGKQSYFFAWNGPLAAFQDPTHVTRPLAPRSTIINLPSGTIGTGGATGGATTLNGNIVQVSAIFTVEYNANDVENPAGVNNGDLNQDGVPDRLVQRYFVDPTAAGGTGTDTSLSAVWFQNLGGFNEDEDFLPVYPTGDNLGVLDFRPIPNPNTAQDATAVNAFTAFMEIRGYDGLLGTADDPRTDPTMNDTDNDGYPDGWEYWFWYQSNINGRMGSRYNPFNVAQGDLIDWSEIVSAFDPMSPRSAYSEPLWRDDFDNDGLLDIEELVTGSDPTNWDTDGDLMADGWEILNGFLPGDGRDGNLPMFNNPDGDYFAISTAPRRHIQVVTTNGGFDAFGDPIISIVTNHYFMSIDTTTFQVIPGTASTAYHYGDDALGPWAVGRPVPDNVLTPANIIPGPADEDLNPLILHFQVRNEYLFDPRTGWSGNAGGGGAPAGWPYDNADRFGPYGTSPNTCPFTAVDEYLLLKFMYELRLNGMVSTNNSGWIARFQRAINLYASNNNAIVFNNTRRILIQESWSRFTTHPHTPDTDGTAVPAPEGSDGIPDGWELYIAVAPGVRGNVNTFVHSPWAAPDNISWEFWGVASLAQYVSPNLYYFGMTNNNPLIGVVTIIRPVDDPDNYWTNKRWPTDPWNADTDFDGVGDAAERAFMYGNAVVPGAGGGLNPCSVDTDRDALPDIWELQYAGTPVDAAGNTSLPPPLPGQPEPYVAMTISNGQDGTVADAYKDADFDGLASYQEYMVQALRCYRYDIPLGAIPNDTTVQDPVTRKIGQPMDITFEIGALFEPVTNVWDQAMFGWPLPTDILWWMRPAGARYCSTDPNNPDTDYDNMDDYYEMFHGLNPLLGNGSRIDRLDDRVAWAYGWPPYPGIGMPPFAYNNNWYFPLYMGFTMDFVQYPWLNGMPAADPDADGLLNLEEMLAVNMPVPENQVTDPSPLWTTDPSNLESLTARFYPPFGYGWKAMVANLYRDMWFWPAGQPPYFTYSFEMNEGYDTDNDGVSDKDEQVTNRNPKSDPRDSEDPLRRQAIWFSGWNSAATTPYMYTDISTVVGQTFADMEQAFRSFTVELWARPEWETNLTEQILIERAFDYGQSDASQPAGEPRLRRNFLIGIAPDGRIFGGFDNAGGHDEHTDNVRLYGEKVISNKWVHLAIRMDGRTQKFTLFVNGVSQGERSTTLIPATGLDPSRYYPTAGGETEISAPRTGTLIIGAANNALVSLATGIGYDPFTYYFPMMWAADWSQYEKFYRGWIDEVRVWDGARSNQEIADNFRKPMTRDEILANRTLILEELNNGAGRNALSTNNFLSPILMNLYTFNNLFSAHAEQYVAQVPRGFNSVAVDANRPGGNPASTIVNWWDQCQVKNTVYNNWHYLPWIENVLAHLPPVTMVTDTNGATVYVNDNFLQDTVYWTRRSAGNLEAVNSFPNTSDPYGFMYGTKQCIDLLPIGDAWAKQCTDFWDDLGATGSWLENSGTLDDGLPLWWKTLHGTTGNWNDLYNGTNTYYSDNGMTNGEVYQRDLAKGMLPTATNTTDYATAYRQTADSNGDGMPDWWKRMYGLSVSDATGENGPLGDPDKDALSNYAEYLITEVYQLRYSNPLKFKTNPAQPVSDYFMKPKGAKLNFGAMFSDHDFIEGWWEELYSPTSANAYVFDSKTDYDDDGWSNWAEARYSQAVAPVRPDLREVVMVNGISAYEYPIPVVDTYISYKGVQTAGSLVIQAFSSSAMVGEADAVWNITFGDNGVQANTLPLGFFSDRVVRTRLSPGSVVPGTVTINLTDSWTGGQSDTGFDMNGVIYSSPTTGVQQPIGTINYVTGEMVLDLGYFKDMVVETGGAYDPANRDSYIDAMVSYFQMSYSTKLPNGWPQHIYLGRAVTGALKEGKNYFFAFIDVDGNGNWDAGEPAGIPTPFETDIGWDENRLEIQLTDYTPYNLRLSLATGLRSEDVVFGTAGGVGAGGGGAGGGGVAAAGGTYTRVRIRRAAVQTSSFSEAIVFDKVIYGRDYVHEGDIMTMPSHGGYGLDWNFGANGILTPLSVGAITYQVYVGDLPTVTNNTLLLTFTNKFDGARAVPVPVSPAHGAYVYTARPTFTWSLISTNSGYNAFAFELRRGSSSGPLVYPIIIRQVPLKNTKTDNYVWEAPFFMGDKNTVNNGVYYWRVQAMSPRYSLTNNVASEWSPWRIFRWDVNSTLAPAGVATNLNGSSSAYGQLGAVVKYFGAVTNTIADRVILQAFKNRGFTGNPAAQYVYSTSQNTMLTNQSLSVTNAIYMRGLTPGVYYVRAFIDSNTNSVLDSWESWGYANYYGDTKAMYDVRPIEVSYSALTPHVTVYIEDSDTDQDWFPDAYEYELNRTASNFLELTGPSDAWSYRGDAEINPTLDTDTFIDMVFAMAMGSSEQQAEIIKLISTDGQVTTPGVAPSVTIESLSFGTGGPSLDFDLTPGQPAQYTSTLLSTLMGVSASAPAPEIRTYKYNVRFSDTLSVPRPWATIVESGTATVDANGQTIRTPDYTNSATGTNGFFYVEIVEAVIQ